LYTIISAGLLLLAVLTKPAAAQKTDTVEIQKGGSIVGEIKSLDTGKLKLSTWAMSTVYIEWPKVLAFATDKEFEIELSNGDKFFGSVQAASDSGMVMITYGSHSIVAETQAIVSMQRVRQSFWTALDGNIDVGVNYNQQNNKTDLSLGLGLQYKKDLNNYKLTFNNAFSRQDSVENISHVYGMLQYTRETEKRLFYATFLGTDRNSQLDLDFRGTIGVGVGDYLVHTNKMSFGFWGGLGFARENYVGEPIENTSLGFLSAGFEYFMWGVLDRELSSNLTVLPQISGEERWRLQFNITFKWEIAHHLYLNLTLHEDFDSNPPSATANNNSFNTTTSLGWSF